MAKKYKKINKEMVLQLFENKEIINRAYITSQLGCSVYSVIRVVEELTDDKKIKLTNYGHKIRNIK